jgi:uroporphyrinogen decarboxylase
LTPRDRVIAAVRRLPADRAPVGMMGCEPSVAAGVRRLLAAPEDADLNGLLGIDFASVGAEYVGPDFPWKPPKQRRSFFGSSDKTYADDGVVERPLRHAASRAEIERFPWPTAGDYDFSRVPAQCDAAGDRAVMTGAWTPTFSQLCELFGMETALYNLAAMPEAMSFCAGRIADLVIGLLRGLHGAAQGRLLIFATADDIATNRALMFSPAVWRALFKPALARQFAAARALGLLTWFHSCGDVSAILPDLVDIGLDVLEPTQAHLPGMRPEWLKREFGAHLTFFGGISTQTTLPFGTPEDVRREVRERIRVLGAGGGYILSPDHNLLDGVPPENVVALYEEAGSLARRRTR